MMDEELARIEAAAAWRALGSLGHVDAVFNHLSISYTRSQSEPIDGFVTNSPDLLAVQARPDTMIAVLLGGDVVGSRFPNSDGLALHLAIHRVFRKDYVAVHVHTPAITMFSATNMEMRPLTQTAMEFAGEVERIKYDGLLRDGSTCLASTVAALNKRKIALLENHGVVIGASNAAEMVYMVHYFDEACRHMLALASLGQEVVIFPDDNGARIAKQRLIEDRPVAALAFYSAIQRQCG